MPAAASVPFIAELEGAIRSWSPERRVRIPRQVTDLFVSDACHLDENQISVFDDVLVLLIEHLEARALVRLSSTLSGYDSAKEAVQHLAHLKEASIAVPALPRSARLPEGNLNEIAESHGKKHLFAICGRELLNDEVPDVLVRRGERAVSRKLAANAEVEFSGAGFSALAAKVTDDCVLAEMLCLRLDIPEKTRSDLLLKAAGPVRTRLLKNAPPELRARIGRAVRRVAIQAGSKLPNSSTTPRSRTWLSS